MTEVAVLAGVAALVAVAAWALRRREGRVVGTDARLDAGALARLGVAREGPALVEFTAPGCRTCAAALAVLEEVAAGYGDVRVVTADVADHLELAREHGILRAPTTLVVDAGGRVRHRVHGVPDPQQLHEVLRSASGRAA